MPNETLITEMENLISEIIALGGENERSQVVPNLTVQNANPSGLDGWLIISDDRDGDNILARKVGSVIYSNNDLVNVMFLNGTEPIAFQQGSGSSNNGIWEIVSGTSTDIYYDKGDVGIGKSVAPDATLEILHASQAQLRLTHTEDTDFVDFQIDTNADLTVTPSGTGQIILQPTTDSTDFFQVLDADGGTPVLNVDSTNERIGIGTATPGEQLDVAGNVALDQDIIHRGDTDTKITFTDDKIAFDAGGLNLLALTETAQDLVEIGDVAGGGDVDINFNNDQMFFRGSDGRLGINQTSPANSIDITSSDNTQAGIIIKNSSAGTGASASIEFRNGGLAVSERTFFLQTGTGYTAVTGWQDAGVFSTQNGISGGMILNARAGGIKFETAGNGSSFEKMRLTNGGQLGIGLTSPQGIVHSYNTISGFLLWEYDGLDTTVRTVIPNGTGDVLYRLNAVYVLRDSAAAVASGSTDVSNGASVNLTVGGNTVRLRVNANGSCDIARTAGTDTIKVALTLRWL